MIRLLLLFTLVPALELFLLLQIGGWLGPWPTFLLLVATGLAGSALLRWQGIGVLAALVEDARQGLPAGPRLAEGALVVVGGLLLITPGVLTDLAGLLLLVPPIRRALAPRLLASLARRGRVHGTVVTFGGPFPPSGTFPPEPPRPPPDRPPAPPKNPFDHPVAR